MKRNYITTLLVLLVISLPVISLAASLIPSDADIAADGFGAFAQLINNIIDGFLTISVSIAAVTFAYGGAQILFHPGNENAISEGKAMLWKTVQGMLIILGAWLLLTTIIGALTGDAVGNGALRFLK